MLCNSVKNKSSIDRCTSKALKNLQFCGKHAKMKKPKLWSEEKANSIVLIQKRWRGYRIRNRMKLQGPGILKRSLCHNDDDLVTCENRDEVHPGNYFSFDEDGKIFWFDIRSIYAWSLEHLRPTNPYTRQPLSIEIRKRLKQVIILREAVGLPLFHDLKRIMDIKKVFSDRWTLIGQYLEENLFEDMNLTVLLNMNQTQFWLFSYHMYESLLLWANEKPDSRRPVYCAWMKQCWRRQTLEMNATTNVAFYVSGTLLKILKDCREPYEVCFQIVAACHRL